MDTTQLKPFAELTEDERSALTVNEIEAYKAQAKADEKRRKKEYRNLLNKLKRESELAAKAPWEDRSRRNRFLYRLGIGSLYYMAALKGEKADAVFERLISHMAEEDRAFTADYYDRWKKADFPTAELAKKAKTEPEETDGEGEAS